MKYERKFVLPVCGIARAVVSGVNPLLTPLPGKKKWIFMYISMHMHTNIHKGSKTMPPPPLFFSKKVSGYALLRVPLIITWWSTFLAINPVVLSSCNSLLTRLLTFALWKLLLWLYSYKWRHTGWLREKICHSGLCLCTLWSAAVEILR